MNAMLQPRWHQAGDARLPNVTPSRQLRAVRSAFLRLAVRHGQMATRAAPSRMGESPCREHWKRMSAGITRRTHQRSGTQFAKHSVSVHRATLGAACDRAAIRLDLGTDQRDTGAERVMKVCCFDPRRIPGANGTIGFGSHRPMTCVPGHPRRKPHGLRSRELADSTVADSAILGEGVGHATWLGPAQVTRRASGNAGFSRLHPVAPARFAARANAHRSVKFLNRRTSTKAHVHGMETVVELDEWYRAKICGKLRERNCD